MIQVYNFTSARDDFFWGGGYITLQWWEDVGVSEKTKVASS